MSVYPADPPSPLPSLSLLAEDFVLDHILASS